jgi:molybdate transport system substrate-binding protein
MRRVFTTPLLAIALLACAAVAQADTLKVLTAGAFKEVLLAAQPAFEAKSGHKLVIDNDTAGGLAKRVAAGEAFDVVVMPPAGLQPLGGAGHVEAASIAPLARVGIGIAMRGSGPVPEVKTADQFRSVVLAAPKVAMVDWKAGGSSGIYLKGLFEKWGIADQVFAKAVLVPGGLSARKLETGEADIAIQQMSELLPVAGPNVTIVGYLPDEIQNYTTYSGAISSRSANKGAARALMNALASPDLAPILRDKGMLAPR